MKGRIQYSSKKSLNILLRLFLILIVSLGSINLAYAINVPANASLHYSGDRFECNSGYRKSGNSCLKVNIPANASLHYSGDRFECNSGYRKSGNSCLKVNTPANASLHYSGDRFECNSGYRKSGNSCLKVNIPANASLHYSGDRFECNSGYRKSGNSCLKVNIPANASLHYSGDRFECNSGYRKSGNSCLKVNIPANASLHYSGDRFECNSGYRKSGNSCLKVNIPANASLHYSGDRFECNSGYRKSGNSCLKVNIPANASLHYSGDRFECNSGYRKSGNMCVGINVEVSKNVEDGNSLVSNQTEEKKVKFKIEGESSVDIQLRLEKEKELKAKISELELKAKESKTNNETLLKTSEEYEAYKVVQEQQLNRKEQEYTQLANDFGDLQDAYEKLKAENQEKEKNKELRQQQELEELEAQEAVIEKRIIEGEDRVEEITQYVNDLNNQKHKLEASILSFESDATEAALDKLVKTEELNNIIAQIVKARDLLTRYKSNENRLQALVDSDQLMLGLKIIIGFLFVLLLISFKSRRKFNKKVLQPSNLKSEFQDKEDEIKEPEEKTEEPEEKTEEFEEPEEKTEEPEQAPKVEEDNNRLSHLKLVEIDKWTQEWNEWISAGISSFDASSVMNKNRFKSSKELIKEKKDKNLNYLDGELVELSELDKQALKSYRSYRSKNKLTNLKHFSFEDLENPGLISTIMMTPDHQSALEIKTDESSYHLANNDGHILPATVIELQHQMMITGLKQIHYWCYLKGYDGILIKVDRNDTLINELLDLEIKIYSKINQ